MNSLRPYKRQFLLWNCLYLENERVGSDQRFSCCASESPGGTLKKIQMLLQTTRKYRCPGLNPRETEPGPCNCSELLMCFRGATRFGNHWPGWSLGIFITGNLVILKQGKGCFQGLYNRETWESKPVLLSTLRCVNYQPSTGKEPLWMTKLHKDSCRVLSCLWERGQKRFKLSPLTSHTTSWGRNSPILQMKKLKFREVKWLTQGHIGSKWHSWNSQSVPRNCRIVTTGHMWPRDPESVKHTGLQSYFKKECKIPH